MAAPSVAAVGTLSSGTGANRTPGIPSGITGPGIFRIFLAGINANNATSNPSVTALIKTASANLPNIEIWYGYSAGAEGPGNYALNVNSGLNNADAQAARITDVHPSVPFFATIDNQRGNTAAPMPTSLTGVPAGSTLFWFCYTQANRTTPVPTGFDRKSSNTQIRHHWAVLENWGGGDTGSLAPGNFTEGAVNNRVVLFAMLPGNQTFSQSLTAVMDGTPTLSRDVTAFRLLSAVMNGAPTLTRAFLSRRTLTAVMNGTATLVRKIAKPLTVVMDGTPTAQTAIKKLLTVVMNGTPSLSRKTSTTLAVVMDGTPTLVKATTAGRSLSAVMNGTATLSTHSVLSRILSAVMNGIPRGEVKFPWGSIPDGSCPADWSPNDGLKSIEGDVFFHEPPNEGDPVVGADVTLIRDSDGLRIATTTTDAAGHYEFPRDTNDPYTYHVEVRYTDGGGNQQGLSEGGCVPS